MSYLIGTDEAGYGPNLGPLIVAANVWHIPAEIFHADLYDVLQDSVTSQTDSTETGCRIVIADSKRLYQSGKGLKLLERTLFPVLTVLDQPVQRWRRLWDAIAPESKSSRLAVPWYQHYDAVIPQQMDPSTVYSLSGRLKESCRLQSIELMSLRARAIFTREFNGLVKEYGSKGTLLSLVTLSLVKQLLAKYKDEPVRILCDKHGARNRYGALLQQQFPDHLVEVYRESQDESVYFWGPARRRVEIRFKAKGESYLPSALASIAAKYLREMAMQAFNSYWLDQIPNLQPTAGYPVDAKRFQAQIEPARRKLKIDLCDLWRER